MSTMKILGIHDGHTATAALVEDGSVKAAVSEDRINRIKEWHGFPRQAVKKVLDITKTEPHEVDLVVISYLVKPVTVEQYQGKKMSFNASAFNLFTKMIPKALLKSNFWVNPGVKFLSRLRNKKEIFEALESIGIPRTKVLFTEHHNAHIYSTLLNWYQEHDDALILTLDGAGDGYAATVNVLENGEIKTIARTNLFSSLGFLYARVTQFMGMKPLSHEYKVMGLAAYGDQKYFQPVADKFQDHFFRIDPKNRLKFENLSGRWGVDYLPKLREVFGYERFDNLAAGLQHATEELILQWVKNAVKHTGIKDVFCSGGVFMNVKTNMRIMYELKDIRRFFVFPSCADESNAIGSAIYGYKQLCDQHGEKFCPEKLKDIYYGPEYNNDQIEQSLVKDKRFAFTKISNMESHVAEQVAKGKIVARFSGRMEFGARALGNRTIIADPRDHTVIRRINEAIKFRDFWMPFAGTIMHERQSDYIVNPKKVPAPYMIMAFETKPKAEKDIGAAIHQWDLTCRPQILEKDWNPSYHKLLAKFQSLTGVGGVLNTSFNIHGDPIVFSPEDALDTLKRSKLDALAIGSYYVTNRT